MSKRLKMTLNNAQNKTYRVNKQNDSAHQPSLQLGFTLIELMSVALIMVILTVIAIPSYRQYTRNQIQIQAQQQGMQISDQLTRWKAKRLTYAGYDYLLSQDPMTTIGSSMNHDILFTTPNNIAKTGANSEFSDASNLSKHRYLITLSDAKGHYSLTHSDANGTGWRMLITPNSENDLTKFADSYYLDSLGQRCRYPSGSEVPDLDSNIYCLKDLTW